MAKTTENGKEPKPSEARKPICGIVMPISAIDGCAPEHWGDVLSILRESITAAGFDCDLVSNADESGIIQKRIIHNLYSNEMVVCDVSGKNPNVMFELGMRLAFDKPTVIVKDDRTDYTFDIGVIEHITYPRDLRFARIVTFKDALRKKVEETHKRASSDANYTTFLKNFGEYKVAQLAEKELPTDQFMLEALGELRREVSRLRVEGRHRRPSEVHRSRIADNERELIQRYVMELFTENKDLRHMSPSDGLIERMCEGLEKIAEVREVAGNSRRLRELVSEVVGGPIVRSYSPFDPTLE